MDRFKLHIYRDLPSVLSRGYILQKLSRMVSYRTVRLKIGGSHLLSCRYQ